MQSDPSPQANLEETPGVDRLLFRLRSKLRTSVLLYGVGTLACILSAWLVFAFLADWGLRVPSAFRVFNGLALGALFCYFLWRSLLKPYSSIPGRRGLALLFERSKPELDEVLSSAIQFQNEAGIGNPVLIGRVLQRADQEAGMLSTASVFDRRPMLSRLLKGLGAAAILVVAAAISPSHAEIFFNRMFGGEMTWPRRTRLTINLPGLSPTPAELDDQANPGVLRLRVARGTDIPVLIRAEGQVPDQVKLHFDNGNSLQLKRSGSNVFRTMLSSCQEDISFYATGGDDQAGRPLVEVKVLQPPDIQSIAMVITPPAYTGEPQRVVYNNDVDVLSGSALRIHAASFPEDAVGKARLLPEDRELELRPGEFPQPPAPNRPSGPDGPSGTSGQAESSSPSTPTQGLYFDLLATSSTGFQLLLRDKSGLTNPDPGLFQVKVHQDETPEILVISPTRSELELVLGGVIPLRARFGDDYAVRSATWSIRPAQTEEDEVAAVSGDFRLRQLPQADTGLSDERLLIGITTIEVDQIGTSEAPVALDQRYLIELRASDSREPQANQSRSLPIRARVVTPESLIIRMQDRLAQAGREARKLSELQAEKRRRVEELIEIFDGASDGALNTGAEGAALASALAGQRRVLGDAEALGRSLARVAEDILYARLDSGADQLLNFHLNQMEALGDVGFNSAPWRALAAAAAADQLGPAGFARNLVMLVELALSISDGEVYEASLALDQAERSIELATRLDALSRASELQTAALAKMELLLEKLAEWDNFQNVLALMRDILNRQKNLIERTQQFATDSKK